MARWNQRYGKWWAIQWCWNGWIGLGIHVDWRLKHVDFHFAHAIVSVGRNPIYLPADMRRDHNCRGGIFI